MLAAIDAMERGVHTDAQRGLLFQNNDVINRARMNGWITDHAYQAVQKDYAGLNEKFRAAKAAVRKAKAGAA